MENTALIYYDMRMLGHNPAGWDAGRPEWRDAVKAMIARQYPGSNLDTYVYPERPERLTTIVDRLMTDPIDGVYWRLPHIATNTQLQRAHSPAHVAYIDSLVGESHWLAQDTTAVSPFSVVAAKLAVGAGIDAVEAVSAGESPHAFCIVRPPGHHAAAEHAMGFCLFNNIAAAAMHARAVLGYSRVMIWDWDVHHGNGTQKIFYEDPDVLVVDSHCAAPFYPGTGHLSETGAKAGLGYHLNVPLPKGSGNAALIEVFEQVVRPAARAFQPEIILISCGFDCHFLDGICAMDETGYAALTQRVCALAHEHCEDRLVMMLEGGYNAQALSDSATAVIRAMTGHTPASINVLPVDEGCAEAARAARFHGTAIAGLDSRSVS